MKRKPLLLWGLTILPLIAGYILASSNKTNQPFQNGRTIDSLVRRSSDSVLSQLNSIHAYELTPGSNTAISYGLKSISLPFPTEWPPTARTAIWIIYPSNNNQSLSKPILTNCVAYHKPECDTSPHIDGEETIPGATLVCLHPPFCKMVQYHPLPKDDSNDQIYFLARLFPVSSNVIDIKIDTLRNYYSDWILETDSLRNHPGLRDLLRAIQEHRIPTHDEKRNIKDLYLANLIEYKYQNFQHLQPGQREFLDWLIAE